MPGVSSDYLRREIQAAAKWVREVVAAHPETDAPRHELDTLEFDMIAWFREIAEHEHADYGKTRHVIETWPVASMYAGLEAPLESIGYVGVSPGRAFGRVKGGACWVSKVAGAKV